MNVHDFARTVDIIESLNVSNDIKFWSKLPSIGPITSYYLSHTFFHPNIRPNQSKYNNNIICMKHDESNKLYEIIKKNNWLHKLGYNNKTPDYKNYGFLHSPEILLTNRQMSVILKQYLLKKEDKVEKENIFLKEEIERFKDIIANYENI